MRGVLIVLCCCVGGCSAKWRPVTKAVHTQPAASNGFDLEPYLKAMRSGVWAYERRELHDSQEIEPVNCPRFAGVKGIREGNLIARPFLPLRDYFYDTPQAAGPRDPNRPIPPLKGGTAFMFELAEPLELFPPQLVLGEPIVSTTALRYYDYDGRRLAPGTLTREVEIEGFDDIETPAGKFTDCLRARVELDVRVSWTVHLVMTNYLWLSPRVGEVRRLQHMSGRFLIFWFASTYRYDLLSGKPTMTASIPEKLDLTPKWKRGAVLLDRLVPRPRIAGMVVDYDDESSAPSSAPATSQPLRQNEIKSRGL